MHERVIPTRIFRISAPLCTHYESLSIATVERASRIYASSKSHFALVPAYFPLPDPWSYYRFLRLLHIDHRSEAEYDGIYHVFPHRRCVKPTASGTADASWPYKLRVSISAPLDWLIMQEKCVTGCLTGFRPPGEHAQAPPTN